MNRDELERLVTPDDDRTRPLLGLLADGQPERASQTDRRSEHYCKLRRRLVRVIEELDEFRHRNAVLAAALGACDHCWGESEDCQECGGDGLPGSFEPDPELFDAIVGPVIESRWQPESLAPTIPHPQHFPSPTGEVVDVATSSSSGASRSSSSPPEVGP